MDNLYAVRTAITDVFQALGSGQLEPRTAGKMLYAIQLVNAVNRRIAEQEAAAAAAANEQAPADDSARVQELPDFEKQFGLPPGADLDAETAAALRQADEEAELSHAVPLPTPPPGMRPGSPAYRIYREESYQIMQLELKRLRHELRDYHQQKRLKLEEMIKKDVLSAVPPSSRSADTA